MQDKLASSPLNVEAAGLQSILSSLCLALWVMYGQFKGRPWKDRSGMVRLKTWSDMLGRSQIRIHKPKSRLYVRVSDNLDWDWKGNGTWSLSDLPWFDKIMWWTSNTG
jgi:hypothetical protein